MNFQTTLEELNKLYESDDQKVEAEEAVEEAVAEETHVEESLTEAADEEAVVEEEEAEEEPVFVEDEAAEEEAPEEEPAAKRLILECSNCGALMIKDEADVAVEAESNLANVEETCQYCEEAAGYVIAGVVVPYEAAEEDVVAEENESEAEELTEEVDATEVAEEDTLEEGIFDFGKKKASAPAKKATAQVKERKVTYTIYDEHGNKQFSHTFVEQPDKMEAVNQLATLMSKSYPSTWSKMKANKHKWIYDKHSVPAAYDDTKSNETHRCSELHFDGISF
jgi:RNase P subunit RPR2